MLFRSASGEAVRFKNVIDGTGHRESIFYTGESKEMETKLYVGNLSYNATDEDLRELFEQAGTVKSVTVMRDRDTGRSRGFAFIEMETNEEAQKAISMFNERDFQERALTVNVARPREDRPRTGGGGFRGGSGGDRGGSGGDRGGSGDRRGGGSGDRRGGSGGSGGSGDRRGSGGFRGGEDRDRNRRSW